MDGDGDGVIDLTRSGGAGVAVGAVGAVGRRGGGAPEGVIDLCTPTPHKSHSSLVGGDKQADRADVRRSLFDMVMDGAPPTPQELKALACWSETNADDAPRLEERSAPLTSGSTEGLSIFAKLDLKQREIECRAKAAGKAPNPVPPSPTEVCRTKRFRDGLQDPSPQHYNPDDRLISIVEEEDSSPPPSLPEEMSRPPPAHVPTPGALPARAAAIKAKTVKAPLQTLLTSFLTPPAASSSSSSSAVAVLRQQDFEVVLLVDRREKAQDVVLAGLLGERVPCALCTLAVGDFLWVARPKTPPPAPTVEDAWMTDCTGALVLDCIAERKALSDLASSLCDGRYRDQKQRILKTGIPVAFYIVEAEQMVLPAQQKAITIDHIRGAMISTFVDSDMHVLRTRGLDHTIRTLSQIHRQVQRRFADKCRQAAPLSSFQTLAAFQQAYSRKPAASHGALLVHQLRQMRGCSMASARGIARHFRTLRHLMDFLQQTDRAFAVSFLAGLHKDDSVEDTGDPADEEGGLISNTSAQLLPVERDRQETSQGARALPPRKRVGPAVAREICAVLSDDY